jgi:hypothetical protein
MSGEVKIIVEEVAKEFQLTHDQLFARTHKRSVARPRQIVMYLCRKHTKRSFPDLATRLGGKHHTTILYGAERIGELMDNDNELYRQVCRLSNNVSLRLGALREEQDTNRLRATVMIFVNRYDKDAPNSAGRKLAAIGRDALNSGDVERMWYALDAFRAFEAPIHKQGEILRLTPLDLHDLRNTAERDPMRALGVMFDRLHRAVLVMATQRGDGPGQSSSMWPAYMGEWWDDGWEGSKLSGADLARRIDAWGADVPKPKPGEIEQSELTLSYLASPPDKRMHQIIAIRAWQEHKGRESWRKAGKMLKPPVSHEKARRLHEDAVQFALTAALKSAKRRAA